MRVVEAEQLASQLARAPLCRAIIRRRYPKPRPRPLVRHIRQRQRLGGDAVTANQRAAAFVRIRVVAVSPNRRINLRFQLQTHSYRGPTGSAPLARRFAPLWSGASSQNRSDRYFSPPSGKITTITESGDRLATLSAATRLAPLEMPTNSPLRASWRFSSKASSVDTPRSSSASDGS